MIKGFFPKNSGTSASRPDARTYSCVSCGLYKDCLSPKMEPFGKFKKKILFLGEAPGETEDRRNKQWQGDVGRLLQATAKELGIDIFQDGLNFNACNCRPPRNETPTPYQIACCRRKVMQVIEKYEPHVIVLLGGTPIKSVIGHRWKKDLGGVSKWRGFCIPDRELGCWVCPTFHPSFVSRKQEKDGRNLAKTIWEQDLSRAFEKVNEPLPKWKDETQNITYIESTKEFKKILQKIGPSSLVSFDFETNMIKPHKDTSKLVSTSLAIEESDGIRGYTWLSDPKIDQLFAKKILAKNIPKTAHNIQFEDQWSYFQLGVRPANWKWCSMNAAHILDNRRGITGLKFQTYVNFGVPDYDSEISTFLQSNSNKDGAYSENKVMNVFKLGGEKSLLKYNALDSIYGLKLTLKQMKEVGIK